MQLRKSQRKQAKIKLALQGSSGSGKTYSSLLIAKGLTEGNLSKVAILDSENGSADLYAHLGNYNVLTLDTPYSPEKYIEAIDVCLNAGMEVIILDSISHAWEFLLDFHSKLAGNSFANWAKITPRQTAFINKILQSPAHFILTMRTKQDYVINLIDGKHVPEKVGLKAIQRDGVDYECTIVFDVDSKHFAVSSKDRTNLFADKPEFKITENTGKKILNWCNSVVTVKDITGLINQCKTIDNLLDLYNENPEYQEALKQHFITKKEQLENLSNPNNLSQNGTSTNHTS